MRKVLIVLAFILVPARGHADMFGGDLAYLAQILQNAIRQLAELKSIVETQGDQLNLLREINRGINDSLDLVKTAYPDLDPGVYRDWHNVSEALEQLESLYGVVKNSPDRQVQKNTDQSVAEAVTLNNDIYKYTSEIDELGEVIKEYSHDVSPGGAQKLTAQTLGVMLQVMNQSLRTQATGLKLQAQAMALTNKKEKEETNQYLEIANTLKRGLKQKTYTFKVPRF